MQKDFQYIRRDVDALMVAKVFSPQSGPQKSSVLSPNEIKIAAAKAIESRIIVSPSVIRDVSRGLINNASTGSWDAMTELLNLRSYVNSTLEEAKQAIGAVYSEPLHGTWTTVPEGKYLEDVSPKVILDGKPGKPYVIFDRPDHIATMLTRVIFKGSHVIYRGGPITLINVFFDNCTFEISEIKTETYSRKRFWEKHSPLLNLPTRSLSEIEFPQPSIAINSPSDHQILGSK
jgi:hypothetical protein